MGKTLSAYLYSLRLQKGEISMAFTVTGSFFLLGLRLFYPDTGP